MLDEISELGEAHFDMSGQSALKEPHPMLRNIIIVLTQVNSLVPTPSYALPPRKGLGNRAHQACCPFRNNFVSEQQE